MHCQSKIPLPASRRALLNAFVGDINVLNVAGSFTSDTSEDVDSLDPEALKAALRRVRALLQQQICRVHLLKLLCVLGLRVCCV